MDPPGVPPESADFCSIPRPPAGGAARPHSQSGQYVDGSIGKRSDNGPHCRRGCCHICDIHRRDRPPPSPAAIARRHRPPPARLPACPPARLPACPPARLPALSRPPACPLSLGASGAAHSPRRFRPSPAARPPARPPALSRPPACPLTLGASGAAHSPRRFRRSQRLSHHGASPRAHVDWRLN
ncbi:hypothetical protein B0H15DRAFT_950407 [Mycena belliarum]|uniref:Uncharacterized protein n=1 Tax=Mycena belliarum TaxID=1033014 RepID=A0AAD6XNG6_9AGAR|nr:hypothetical protein B0H15DRAFT_950407 [Mycena belliae]